VTRATKKASFNLDSGLLAELQDAVARGAAPTESSLVENALRRELSLIRRQWRRTLWEVAAADPLFPDDVAAVQAEFAVLDAETARSSG